MTLYFDTRVQFLDNEAISTVGAWHPIEPLLAVASYSPERGGSVTIFDDMGEPFRDISFPIHSVSQATALSWHPERRLLVTGWENGEVHTWSAPNREFCSVNGPHKAPITLLAFSEQGGRMVTADSNGVLTGWRCENVGHFLTMFTHDLRDTLIHITFRKTVRSAACSELSSLAKAAVEGDESALDTLTNWRPRTAARNLVHTGVKDNHCFYVGTLAGVVYYLNQSGICTKVLSNEQTPITQIVWHPKRDAVIALTDDMTVCHYLVESNGALTELDRVKLSSRGSAQSGSISWAGNGLAIITGDLSVRIWNIDTSDNFLLSMKLPGKSTEPTVDSLPTSSLQQSGAEMFTSISYSTDNQTLCAGTSHGRLYTWKRIAAYKNGDSPEMGWQLNNISSVRGAIKQCSWGMSETMRPCVMVNCVSNVYILKEQPLIARHSRYMWASQQAANKLTIEHESGVKLDLKTDISIIDIALSETNVIVTNGKSIIVYKISMENNSEAMSAKILNTFLTESLQTFIYEQTVIVLGQQGMKILSFAGVMLQDLNFTTTEGKPIGADLSGHFLTTFTINGYIKIYDVSRHEPKLIVQPKSGYDLFENFGEFITAKCNSDGTRLAATIATETLIPNGKLYVWDIGRSASVVALDFLRPHETITNQKNGKNNVSRLPVEIYWDTYDNRLLACELRCVQQQSTGPSCGPASSSLLQQQQQPQHGQQSIKNSTLSPGVDGSRGDGSGGGGGGGGGSNSNQTQITSQFSSSDSLACVLFVTEKNEIKELESISLRTVGVQLVNFCAPHAIILEIGAVKRIALRDFKGLEKCDASTRKMVLDFSLNVAQGNMDQAFRCIRSLESEAVWMNLAKMCVHTGRLDVAKACLGHLKRARSVRALRKAMEDESLEHEARIAVLAIELHMFEEAESLYKKCGRYDLLNRLLQASGKFEEALQIAERCDRVHLKNTYYKYGQWLRVNGNISEALQYFSKSKNSTHNVTQILMEDPVALRQHMLNTNDSNLLKWWAQYIESTGDMEAAYKIYQKADDWFSQVRILCFLGELTQAENVARQSADRAACYHLARHYENIGKIQEAIQFYTRAQTYGNAVRICKENDLHDELWTVASLAHARDKASAAGFFEDFGDYKRAVELYHRGGMLHKAVEMAFASKQPETLQVIASELDASADPELVTRCAEFFLQINQPLKAVQLLANTRQIEKALIVCSEHGVPITESLAEHLTPAKNEFTNEQKSFILQRLGETLQEQGDYHTATKKFTQAGDKIRAMKSLLKSGDTDKIVFFAGMSRQKEVYIMAGNYLQALNWQNDSKILKNIITFYTKGQAFDLLANFYVTCAQMEIEEYRDYEKASKALHEASRFLARVTHTQRMTDQLQMTITEVRKVLDLQEALDSGDFSTVIAGSKMLLAQNERLPVRHSDISALLIEALIRTKQFTEALGYLRELALKVADWSARGLVDRALVERLASECGIDFETIWDSGRNRMNQDIDSLSDFEEEDIQEDDE